MTDGKAAYAFNNVDEQFGSDAELRAFAQEAAIVAVTEALSDAMEFLGVSRAELARRLSRTPSFVSQVLSGGRNMTLRTVADIAFALGLQLRNVDFSPVGEMKIPHDAMDEYLDQHRMEITNVNGSASTTRNREDLELTSATVVGAMPWAA